MVALVQQSNILDFPIATLQGKSNEWYTPAKYVNAAREVMGGAIDLDPASCKEANMVVRAEKFYTQHDNGLNHSWYGRVWLNPPYLRTPDMKARHLSTIEMFTMKLIQEYESSNISQAILLATCKQDARWFQPLWKYPICFTDHHVLFSRPLHKNVKCYSQMFGTIFVYLGPNEQKFIDTFSQFGRIAKAIDTPRRTINTPSLWEETT
jgi:hypothetical protein